MLSNIVFNKVGVEVTRRCNMACKHCLRGDAQNMDIDLHKLDVFLYRLRGSFIREIFFTGGEPSLNEEAIRFTINTVKKYGIVVKCYSAVINGKDFPNSLVDFINSIPNFLVSVSFDKFHDVLSDKDIKVISRLNSIVTKDRSATDYNLMNMGRALENNIGVFDVPLEKTIFSAYEDNLILMTPLLCLCTGDIINTCSYSFTETDKHKICNYNDDIKGILFKSANPSNRMLLSSCVGGTSMYRFFDYLKKENLVYDGRVNVN